MSRWPSSAETSAAHDQKQELKFLVVRVDALRDETNFHDTMGFVGHTEIELTREFIEDLRQMNRLAGHENEDWNLVCWGDGLPRFAANWSRV
jgi:hypothetical protein